MSDFLFLSACTDCPSSDAMAVYSDHTYCFSCGKVGRSMDGIAVEKPKRRGGKKLVYVRGEIVPLRVRGIDINTCRKYNYRWSKETRQHIAPYYKDDQLVAQKLRGEGKEFSIAGTITDCELFGQHLWRDKGKRIIVTEGEIDCLTFAQAFNLNWGVVSVPNGAQSAPKAIKRNLEFLSGYEEIVLAFDNDDEGIRAVNKCAQLLPLGKVKVVHYPTGIKDANEMLVQGATNGDICKLVYESRHWRPDGIVSGTDIWDDMESLYDGSDLTNNYELPYPELNRMTQGLRQGELWTFCAGTGVGKSTVVNELGYYLMMQHDCNIGVVALEESIKRTALRYISIHTNTPLHLGITSLGKDEYKKAYKEVIANSKFFLYDHFGSLESDNLLSKIRYMAKGCDCQFIILDHISISVSGIEGGDERRVIDNLMTKLRSLVEETGIGCLIVSHLKRVDGKPHEEGGRVKLADLRGSGSIAQLSDCVVGMERDLQSDDKTSLITTRVLKCRHTGETGTADTLDYKRDTGRIIVAGSENFEPVPVTDNDEKQGDF